jgi:beta-glucosidase
MSFKNSSWPVSERVEDLLQRMTLAEKIGQMSQLDITLINTTGEQQDVELDPEKARKYILKHHVGSFLNGEAASPEAWHAFMNELTHIAVEESRLGIPIIYGIDHIHGATYLEGATIFPQSLNLGATFNPEHAYQAGRVTAVECADLGHHWIFAPVLDLGVNPMWPRIYETYGEDPYNNGTMGAAFVKGLQESQETEPYKLAATAKHFIAYSDPASGWDRTPVQMPMQQLHEFHRPSFQKAVDAGLKTVMLNSGELNGVPVHASYELQTKLLRDQMGFDGIIVTDWDDVGKLADFHYTSENFKEATYDAVMAGIDVCMTPLHLKFNTSLVELVEEGRIPESRIDESVRRVLQLKFDLGLFEHPYPRNDRFARIGSAQHRQKALEAAQESVVLLKNENDTLPARKPAKIGVLGPSADSKRNLSGGWSIAWQGADEARYPDDMVTVYTALGKEFPDAEVQIFPEADINKARMGNQLDKNTFLKALNACDLLIYAGGETPYTEFVGNIVDLSLPETQQEAVKMLSQSRTPLVLLLLEGRPRLIHQITEHVDAILFAGLPGFEGAEAIAHVISGKVNPSGKMPVSYPKSPNHFIPYHHKRSQVYFFNPEKANQIIQGNESASLFPFGEGLSYTSFEYSDLEISAGEISPDEELTASVIITNTGDRAGKEAVLWYISTHFGKITRPVKLLAKAEKVMLQPGESRNMTFRIDSEALTYPDNHGNAILERTAYSVMVGQLRKKFMLTDASGSNS